MILDTLHPIPHTPYLTPHTPNLLLLRHKLLLYRKKPRIFNLGRANIYRGLSPEFNTAWRSSTT
ncbi:MAG: hypothetical protein DRJ15_15955 [Bacteroidetes bacterium]|nr:MAG: hypothetical protein DRJ15_15955 [Bacteroidota bacterium]